MDQEKRELLEVTIVEQIKSLRSMNVGSDEYKIAVDGISKLADRVNESYKNDYDYWAAEEARKLEKESKEKQLAQEFELKKQEFELKKQQLAEERMDHIIKNCLTAAGSIAIPLTGAVLCMRWEDKGLIPTTIPGREFITSLFRRK